MFHFLYKYFIKGNVKSSQTVCHDEILSASVAIFHSRNVATGQEKFSLKKTVALFWFGSWYNGEKKASPACWRKCCVSDQELFCLIRLEFGCVAEFNNLGVGPNDSWLSSSGGRFFPPFFPSSRRGRAWAFAIFILDTWKLKDQHEQSLMISDERATILGETGKSL